MLRFIFDKKKKITSKRRILHIICILLDVIYLNQDDIGENVVDFIEVTNLQGVLPWSLCVHKTMFKFHQGCLCMHIFP